MSYQTMNVLLHLDKNSLDYGWGRVASDLMHGARGDCRTLSPNREEAQSSVG